MSYVDTPQSRCRFGIARGDITPPVGIYHRMWGAASHDRATGIHRPLTATAAVFQSLEASTPSPDDQQVVIALDHCLLGSRELDLLLDSVCQRSGLPRETVLVAFSHTHAAGLMGLDRQALPGGDLIAGYLEEVGGRVAELVLQAQQTRQPAWISYGTGRCDLATHRDFWDADRGQYVCGYNPHEPGDDTVLVARVSSEDRRWLASLVNYACHPTTLAWENQCISPDYPGAMREVVEQATGVPCLFLQGASGDLGPKEGFVGDVEVADRNGRQLGYAALSALTALPPPGTRFQYTGPVTSGATLGTWAHVPLPSSRYAELGHWQLRRWTVPLDYRPDLPTLEQVTAERADWQATEEAARAGGDQQQAQEARAMAERSTRLLSRLDTLPPGPSLPFSVVLWRMGDALWLAVEGEHYSVLQRALRERFPGTPIVVTTLANSWRAAYLPPADAYGKGIYQESVAVLAAGCLEKLTAEIGSQIERLRPS